MNKEIVKQVILEFQEFEFPFIVEREIEIPTSSQKIVTISGPRRSGKTYLLFSLMQSLITLGVKRDRILYINFDDPRVLPCDAKGLEVILENFWELYPENQNKMNYLFFDEIQNVQGWELGVRRIYDTKRFHIFITGSSSKIFSKEIATSLRGRAINFEVLPFSFREFLKARNIEITSRLFYSRKRFKVKKLMSEYLSYGGFPEVILEKGSVMKLRIMKEYIETMFLKDVVERYNLRNQVLMRELMKYLITNVSNLFSLNAFWRWIKQVYPITKRTLIQYLSYLEDSDFIFLVRKFSFSLKEQILNPRKIYIVDNGLRQVFGFRFSEDKGRIIENTMYLVLKQWQIKDPLLEIFYWHDNKKRELDFIVKRGKEIKILIQICSEIGDILVEKREIDTLLKAMGKFKKRKALIVTEDYEEVKKIKGKKLIYIPIWKIALLDFNSIRSL